MMDRLEGLHRADAAIIGGGLTGLLLASALSEAGLQVAVVDARDARRECASSVASMLCAPSFSRITAAYGQSTAKQYAASLQVQLHALTASPPPYVREIPVYAYAFRNELPMLERQHELLHALQIPISIAPDAGGCPFPVELSLTANGTLIDVTHWQDALQSAILRNGGRIYRNSRVIAIDNGRLCTRYGCLDAPQIILATGKPLGLLRKPLLALLESAMLAQCDLTGGFPLHSCQKSICEEGLAFHPTPLGLTAAWDTGRLGMPAQQHRLQAFTKALQRLLPDWQHGELRYAHVVRSLDGLPLIGLLPGSQTLCIAATDGFGVLGAMHAAEVMARRICGNVLPEDAQYAPDRSFPRAVIRPALHRRTSLYARNMLRHGAPACSHCACRLRYSTAARRWECPWCGTCFSMLGQVISGPGMRSVQVSIRQRPDL